MTIENVPFATVSWENQPAVPVPGESGLAQVKTVLAGAICLRMVEFTPGYRADHWCSKGHIVLVLSVTLTTVLQDGRAFETTAGSSFHVGEGDGHHRVETQTGATVFIAD
jgi:quercetin dioxygenase-like cupin family protein